MLGVHNPLKFVPATKSVASTGLANARRLAGRWGCRITNGNFQGPVLVDFWSI